MSVATLKPPAVARTVWAYHSPVASSIPSSEEEWIAQVADGDADAFALDGTWRVERQSIAPVEGKGRLRLSYRGKQVNLVISGEGDLTWTVNGQTRTAHVSGVPNGMELVSTDEAGSGVLELEASPGLQLYSFTFG